MTFGSMWRRMMRRWPKPAARAASMYGISRTASALARTTRAQRGIIGDRDGEDDVAGAGAEDRDDREREDDDRERERRRP